MSDWHSHLDNMNAAIDKAFASRWRFEPMGASDIMGARPDATRAAIEVDAVFTQTPGLKRPEGRLSAGKDVKFALYANAGEAELSVNPQLLPDLPRRDDIFRAISRPGQPAYQVMSCHDDGVRLKIALKELRRDQLNPQRGPQKKSTGGV